MTPEWAIKHFVKGLFFFAAARRLTRGGGGTKGGGLIPNRSVYSNSTTFIHSLGNTTGEGTCPALRTPLESPFLSRQTRLLGFQKLIHYLGIPKSSQIQDRAW